MHAVLVRVNISDSDAAAEMLKEQIVPRVSQADGFVTGHWTRSADQSNGTSLLIFESEDAARGVAEMIESGTALPDAVTLDSVEVREVVAHA